MAGRAVVMGLAIAVWSAADGQTAAPQAEAAGDDIVVVARKLRKVRLDYAVQGGELARCIPARAATEPRIGRIMCAILRACVAEGAVDEAPASACMTRKIDSLDALPPLPATTTTAAAPSAAKPTTGDIVVTARPEEGDIVVVGRTPMLRGGLWRFDRSATLSIGGGVPGSGDNGGISRSIGYTVCLEDGALEQLMRDAAALQARLAPSRGMGMRICNRLSVRFRPGRLDAHRSCAEGGALPSRLSINGRYDGTGLTINYLEEQDHDGHGFARPSTQRWRINAKREGACPARPHSDQRLAWEMASLLFSNTPPGD